ncbi:MAG TPA: aminopeptidase [Cytophagaceae bacterium]|jgi:predicted aminopeptidase
MNLVFRKIKQASLKRKIFYAAILALLILVAFNLSLIIYGVTQGVGQLTIVWNSRLVEEVLKENNISEDTKSKIRLVQEIRKFAFDSLGLKHSENYTTFYDQKGKPILWILTAAEAYQLKAIEWSFPLLGSFSYKGFFDLERAKREEIPLKQEGYDTSIDEVGGWSTLGWFKDPILSNMLERSPGSLANLIIHELTHGTLYVKNNVTYNENLANFVGDRGAEMFIYHKFGPNSKELDQYRKRKMLSTKHKELVLQGADRLDSLYKSFGKQIPISKKQELKSHLIKEISFQINELHKDYSVKFKEDLDSLNNTYFLDVKRYNEKQNQFEEEFKYKFNSDFKKYMAYLRKTYPSL